ncbi:hypothetical protein [Amycolatopsis palatopharyngis]|uniref:hypothetical protein n=1 Tax=Amycolatopsis palatopharyngis TaxID=187982 RepID=UPI000E23227D|nr:hypothetical protein [Amycolatopsis palatopharyngis]
MRPAALRAARGGLLTCSSAVPAIVAHALADGGMPRAVIMVLLTPVIGWLATVLAERLHGLLGVVLVLGVAQVVMHVMLGGHGTHTPADPVGPSIHSGVDPGAMVLAAHLGATILTAILLARAESMLQAVAVSLRRLVHTVWRLPPIPSGAIPAAIVRAAGCVQFVDIHLRRVHGRRGPPENS